MATVCVEPMEREERPGTAAALAEKIRNRTARVGVIGLGYVGLPLSLELCGAGFDVTGIDVQASPGGCTVEIRHTVFTAVLLAPRRFGFAVVFSGIAICNQHLAQTLTI